MSYQPPGEYAHLYALRYDFLPNEGLKNEVGTLFQSGKAPDFLFHSSKEAYVDAALYTLHRYGAEEASVKHAMEEAVRPFAIGAATFRLLGYEEPHVENGPPKGMVRLSFLPASPYHFHQLMNQLNVFPDMYPRAEPPRHYLYTEFQAKHLAGAESAGALLDTLGQFAETASSKIEKNLFSASVVGLSHSQRELPLDKLRAGWRSGRD